MSYGDFCGTYFKDCEGLLKLLIRNGLVPEKKLYEKCGKECRVDISRKAFRCDKTYTVPKKGKKNPYIKARG